MGEQRSTTSFDFDASVRTIELRLSIAHYLGFGEAFHRRYLRSDSNSKSAIYFISEQVRELAAHLDASTDGRKGEVYDAVREAVGLDTRDGRELDWVELATICDHCDVAVDEHDLADGPAPPEDASSATNEPSGPEWARLAGGDGR